MSSIKKNFYLSPSHLLIDQDDMNAQVRENPPGNFTQMHRIRCKGGWTFGVPDHNWVVSDCTAEGLTVRLQIMYMYMYMYISA